LNFAETFDSQFSLLGPGAHPGNPSGLDSVVHHGGDAIVVADAHLLFSGDFSRSGVNLVITDRDHDHRVVVQDYFRGHSRAALASPDGARLSPQVIEALTGEVQVAQAQGGADASAAKVIGHVTKLVGSATAIRNGVAIQLNVGDTVNKGDVVQAGANSSLGLTFIDGTVFGLSANARMVLNEMVYDPNGSSNSSLLSLVQGTITFVAGETAKHGDMKVDTPVATMGIRGTAVLVEIGFEVPGQGGAPPVKFQVLVEPGNHVGEYVLYSKTDPTVVIGTVNSAGQVTTVTGAENVSTTTAPVLPPIAQDIISFTLQQYFPNYVPNANPQSTPPSTGSPPPATVPGTSNPDPLNFAPPDLPVGVPTTIPINLPGTTPGAPPTTYAVTITALNTPPTIVVSPVVVTLPIDSTSFNLGDHVQVTDPDSANPVFNDVIVPYVAGTGRVISAVGPSGSPPDSDLAQLVTVDPDTGVVSYDPAAFKFLPAGTSAVYTIGFDSRSGPDTVHETLTFTVDGVNDAAAVAAPLTAAAMEGDGAIQLNLLAGASDPDLGDTATLTVTGVTYQVDAAGVTTTAPAGVTLTGATLSVDPSDPAFDHLAQGETTTIVVSYDVTDSHGAVTHQTETITITGSNDAPTVAAALTTAATEGGASVPVNLLAGATDVDTGETATLTVANVSYAVDGGTGSTTAPAGLVLTGSTLSIDPTDPAFNHLAQGQTTTIVVSYDVTDSHGAVAHQTETVTITGSNDAPTVAAALTTAATEGGASVPVNLLAGATDVDTGETATLTVVNVSYAVDGGTASATPPAGLSRTGATLSVDPSDPAFNHLAQGQTTTIVVSYDVTDSHGAIAHQTETVTITGSNDAPTVAAALTTAATEGGASVPVNLLAGATDVDSGETATLTVGNVSYAVDGGTASATPPAGLSRTGATLSVDPSDPAFNHLAQGQTTTIVVSYDVTDSHGAVAHQTETVTITGSNDAPTVAAALTTAATEGGASVPVNLLAGATDVDNGEAATLAVGNVSYAVDGGTASATPPVGLSRTGATLSVDPTDPAFDHLAQGQTTTIVVSYDVTDSHGAVAHQTETITITGTNDAPVIVPSATTATGLISSTAGATVSTGGTIAFADVDRNDTHSALAVFAGAGTALGALSLAVAQDTTGSGAGGQLSWTYSANAAAVEAALLASSSGTLTETFDVTIDDGQGGTVVQTVTVDLSANVWTGKGTTDNWNDVGNWSLSHVPTSSEVVLLNISTTINLTADVTLAGLHIAAGTSVDITTTGGAHTLDITGGLVNDGDLQLAPNVTLEIDGVVQNSGQLTVDNYAAGSTLLIDGHAQLEGGGTVTLDGTADRITGTHYWYYNATLENVDNTINGYGRIGDGHLNLVNDADGTIAATNWWHALVIDTGFGSFINYGSVVSAAAGGLEIEQDIVNYGTLEAQAGRLQIEGNVTGHGIARIDGGTLEFGGYSDANVTFSGNSGDTLVLDRGSHFTGSVSGLASGDSIDLSGISPWQVRITSHDGALEVRYGWGWNDYFTITDPAMLNHLAVSSDRHGGTEIDWINHAPSIDTSDVHISQGYNTTTISGLSVTDVDAASSEIYRADAASQTGSVTPAHQSGNLSTIDGDLDSGFRYTSGGGSVGKVAVSVTDSFGATDSVNFVFSTSHAPLSTPLSLNGTSGRDVIFASAHADTLSGYGGADQFVFAAHSGRDTITDFAPGQDTIQLDFDPSGYHSFQYWLSHNAHSTGYRGQDTLITFDNSDSLLLRNVSVWDLHASDFIVHSGGSVGV